MPPIHSKPRSMETSNDSDTIESENRPTLSIDLSEIINNAVTRFKSSTLKNNKRKRKFKFPFNVTSGSLGFRHIGPKKLPDNHSLIKVGDWIKKVFSGPIHLSHNSQGGFL